jgi:excisionase family DNA binding protein
MELMDIEELSKYLKVTTKTIYRLIKSGELTSMKVGHLHRFSKEQIDEWLLNSAKRNKAKDK